MRQTVFLCFSVFSFIGCGGSVSYDDNSDSDSESESEAAGGAAAVEVPSAGGDDSGGGAAPGSSCDDFQEPTSCGLVPPIVVTPTELSPTDGCEATFACDAGTLVVRCDGENDGTGTSLCECHFNGDDVKYGGLVDGEGESACMNGYLTCIDPTCSP